MRRFTEHGSNRYTLLPVLLAAVLSACSFVPQRSVERSAENSDAEQAAMAAGAVVDPYLRDRPAVPPSVQAEFDTAVAAMQAKQWGEAEPRLQQLTEREPGLSGPFLNLALLYAQTQRPALAEQFFQRAIEVNPNNLAARNQYGIWLREQGRFREAEATYREALTRWADFPDAHLNLGILYDLYLGRLPEALQHYQRYLELRGAEETPVQGWVADLQRRLQSAG